MTALQRHEKAMHHSFLARQARSAGDEDEALKNYEIAAQIESEVADYYIEKPELEPTRSILVRSAAFLNMKAGAIEKAEKYIFHGIINSTDEPVKEQLYEALEICLALRDVGKRSISKNMDYIYKLRQKSVLYILEPNLPEFGSAVTLDMISSFSDNYVKSLKGFSKSEFRDHFAKNYSSLEKEEKIVEEFQKVINPVVTNAAFGSFKFSLAIDFLAREGESDAFVQLKSNILLKYHEEVFKNDFTEENIEQYKKKYTPDEIDEIFRPVFNMRSNKANYRIGYYDRETLKRQNLTTTKNKEKSKLLPRKQLTFDNIGFLEQTLTHTRESISGAAAHKIILKQQLKSSTFDYRTKVIEPGGRSSVILNDEILLNVDFDSSIGFVISFEDLDLAIEGINFSAALNEFYNLFINAAKYLSRKSEKTLVEEQQWAVIRRLINNPESLS